MYVLTILKLQQVNVYPFQYLLCIKKQYGDLIVDCLIPAPERDFLPNMDDYFAEATEQIDPANQVEDQYK